MDKKMIESFEKKTLIGILILFILITIIIFFNSESGYLKEGMEIPDFYIYDLRNNQVSKADLSNQILVINFWATWCPPCREEIPVFIEMKRRYEDRGIKILLVNIGEDVDDIEKFMRENKYDIDIYIDKKGETAKLFGTNKYPETYIIDGNGILRKKIIGSIDWKGKEEVWRYLDEIINEERNKQNR